MQSPPDMPPLFAWHNERLGGDLADRLRSWAEDDEATLQDITWRLRELGIEVAPPTVARWLDRLGIDRRRKQGSVA